MRRLDILVHASITGEPFGQVITEGMAAGKPVIATRGGGVPEIITHGETGLLIPMGDADALASELTSLLDNPGKKERSRKRATSMFATISPRGTERAWWNGSTKISRPRNHAVPYSHRQSSLKWIREEDQSCSFLGRGRK